MIRSILSGLIWDLAILGAIPTLWLPQTHLQIRGTFWRSLGAWRPTTTLTVFFVTSLIGEYLIYHLAIPVLYSVAGDDWGWIWGVFVWRGSSAISAAYFLVGSWSGTYWVFLGRKAVR